MSGSRQQSLRGRITLLALLTCAFLAVAGVLLFRSVRASQAATQNAAQKHLSQLASTLVERYFQQVATGISLPSAAARRLRSKPAALPNATSPSALAKRPDPEPPSPPPLPPPAARDALSTVTAGVLGKEDNLQGGFVAPSGVVVGYASANGEGPPTPPLLPPPEHSFVQHVAQEAIQSGRPQTRTVRRPHDLLLVIAQPLIPTTGKDRHTLGAAWVMHRLPSPDRGQRVQLLFTGVGFGAAALVTALLAWFLIAEVQGGVAAVTRRLSTVQRNLHQPLPPETSTHVAEFKHLIDGIDGMALALRTRIAKERALEEALRHKERLSSLGQFAAGVAHELRNPLATIRLRAQMSQHTVGDAVTARNTGVILEEVDRLDVMIGRLLQFARPIALDRTTFDVNAMCREVQEAWSARIHADLSITCHLAEGATICGDRNRLHQVLDNLVENAVQASQPGASIVLETTSNEDTVILRVLDRGTGFTVEARTHAMDPFFTTKAAGTGLGLSIAFEMVTAHNGTLTIEPRSGGGSVVTVMLPKNVNREEPEA